jgi:hypothetical protein
MQQRRSVMPCSATGSRGKDDLHPAELHDRQRCPTDNARNASLSAQRAKLATMTDSENAPDPEDRRQHLGFIQSVIIRMSAASTQAKGWLLPVVTATYGYALTQKADSVAVLGIGGVLIFALMDANYLNQERSFRGLYDSVVRGDAIPAFSMDPSLTAPAGQGPPASRSKQFRRSIRRWFPPWKVWTSWAVAPFYGTLIAIGIAIWARVR